MEASAGSVHSSRPSRDAVAAGFAAVFDAALTALKPDSKPVARRETLHSLRSGRMDMAEKLGGTPGVKHR